MRHKSAKKTFSRKTAPRRALFASLVNSMIHNGSVKTTTQKAKALRPIVENLVTKAKKPSVHTHRTLSKVLTDAHVKKLVKEISPKYMQRNGGYTRIIKVDKQRPGDGASTSIIEFV